MTIAGWALKRGAILGIIWVSGFFLANWITGYPDNPVVAVGFSFTVVYVLGIVTKDLTYLDNTEQ